MGPGSDDTARLPDPPAGEAPPGTPEAEASLRSLAEVRTRTRFFRGGHWFAAVVFGVVVLGAMPFYLRTVGPVPNASRSCSSLGRMGTICIGAAQVGTAPLGGALSPMASFNQVSRWATVYWAVAVVLGYALVIAYYRRRARAVGVAGRLWPSVVVGLVLLGAVIAAGPDVGPGDFWARGTAAVLVIAVGICVLALLERSRPFAVFAAGLLGLSLLTCLYSDINVFARLGIAGPFMGGGSLLPNLLVPGAYLLVGGVCFYLGRRWTLFVQLRRLPV